MTSSAPKRRLDARQSTPRDHGRHAERRLVPSARHKLRPTPAMAGAIVLITAGFLSTAVGNATDTDTLGAGKYQTISESYTGDDSAAIAAGSVDVSRDFDRDTFTKQLRAQKNQRDQALKDLAAKVDQQSARAEEEPVGPPGHRVQPDGPFRSVQRAVVAQPHRPGLRRTVGQHDRLAGRRHREVDRLRGRLRQPHRRHAARRHRGLVLPPEPHRRLSPATRSTPVRSSATPDPPATSPARTCTWRSAPAAAARSTPSPSSASTASTRNPPPTSHAGPLTSHARPADESRRPARESLRASRPARSAAAVA